MAAKGVSVVEAEGREPMTLQDRFPALRSEMKFLELIFLPKIFAGRVSFGGGLVQRVLLQAETAVDFRYEFPVERGEPPPG